MPVRMRTVRLVLALALGLAFFGCVGLPRRRPPTEGVRPGDARRQNQDRDVSAAPLLRIPEEPKPVAEETAPTKSEVVPVSERPLIPSPPRVEQAVGEQPSAESPSSLQTLRGLYEAAKKRYDGIDSYHVLLTRREVVRGKAQPEERLLFRFRKHPFSVYMKWLGPVADGREVTFVKGKFEGKLHTLLAAGDMPFAPAGKRMSLSPDSIFVRNSSRHAITEAGVGTILEQFRRIFDAMEKGDNHLGTLTYAGQHKRDEFSQPMETVLWSIPPGVEAGLPKGGRRWCFIDPEHHLPALLITLDERGKEVEYYRYERWGYPAHLDDDDFDPDKLWSKPAKPPSP